MQLHEPIAGFKPLAYPQGDVTQFFGENPSLYKPLNLAGHNGWDIVRAWGTPIMCVQSGKVVEVSNNPAGNGKLIRILCDDNIWAYGHLSEILVTQGQEVKAGDVIGKMGNTGFVVSSQNAGGFWKYNPYAGTHLHLGRKRVKRWSGEPYWNESYPTGDRVILLDPLDNGYYGASDFNASDFSNVSTQEQMPSDRAALLAAEYRAQGNTKMAALMDVVTQLLKTWSQ